jgi:hypothetical protein
VPARLQVKNREIFVGTALQGLSTGTPAQAKTAVRADAGAESADSHRTHSLTTLTLHILTRSILSVMPEMMMAKNIVHNQRDSVGPRKEQTARSITLASLYV